MLGRSSPAHPRDTAAKRGPGEAPSAAAWGGEAPPCALGVTLLTAHQRAFPPRQHHPAPPDSPGSCAAHPGAAPRRARAGRPGALSAAQAGAGRAAPAGGQIRQKVFRGFPTSCSEPHRRLRNSPAKALPLPRRAAASNELTRRRHPSAKPQMALEPSSQPQTAGARQSYRGLCTAPERELLCLRAASASGRAQIQETRAGLAPGMPTGTPLPRTPVGHISGSSAVIRRRGRAQHQPQAPPAQRRAAQAQSRRLSPAPAGRHLYSRCSDLL